MMLTWLVPYQVRFRPYQLYPIWDELDVELAGICQVHVLSGRRMEFLEHFQFQCDKCQFGLVQDIPPNLVKY